MKKQLLFLLLTLVSWTLLAQKNLPAGAAKTAPPQDPTQLQGPPPDTEPPAVVCLNGLSGNLFQTGQITLWASDFLLSVSDNVIPEIQIKIGIRKAGSGTAFPVDANGNPLTSVGFNCNELGQQPIELWAIDEAGNAGYCESFVLIEDNFSYCNQTEDTLKICVNFGCDGAPIVGLPINIYGTANFLPPFQMQGDSVTGTDGCATIVVPATGYSYLVTPEKDDNPQNGLTTHDLFLISKHILGTEPLDNPYKLIAADANKSGSITTFDLLELRKLLLGIYAELPNNTSWRFIDGNFVFPNPLNPFGVAFPEYIFFEDGQMTSGTFVGIKTGDVDCSASIDSLGAPADFPDALLTMPDTLLLAGQEYEIPISMAENGLWSVYQFALNWDALKLEFQSMALNNETSLSNWNTLLAQQGSLSTSWFQYDLPVAFGPDDPIVTIRLKALQTVSLKDVFFLNKDLLYPEGYAGPSAEKKDLVLTFLHQFKPSKSDLNAERNQPMLDPTQLGDFAPPTIVCLNGLSVNIMPTGSVSLWATDFLQYTQDNATPVDQIKLGVRIAGTGSGFPLDGFANPVSSLTLTCAMVDSLIPIELWAMDASGNAAFCTTHVLPQDAAGSCSGSNGIDLHLCARVMCNDAAIETALFYLNGSVNFAPPFSYFDLSDASGCRDLLINVPVASTFQIFTSKDDNPLNGMNEQDFNVLSKHLDGTQPFTDPWQWVAADANRDGLITVEDSVEFRNLSLGIYPELPNNTSWRFVPQGYQFPSPDPLSQPLPEYVSLATIVANMDTIFLGIKIGDLDCSAIPNFAGITNEQRNQLHPLEQAKVDQLRPNPTTGASVLPIYLSSAEAIHFEINDISGKVIWFTDQWFVKI